MCALLRARAQLAGVALTIIGVSITVVGLHGMKLWGSGGRMMRCTKRGGWYGSLAFWLFGQFLLLLATALTSEPIFAIFSNTAIFVNALLGVKLQHEKVTSTDIGAMCAMSIGACFVLFCSQRCFALNNYKVSRKVLLPMLRAM